MDPAGGLDGSVSGSGLDWVPSRCVSYGRTHPAPVTVRGSRYGGIILIAHACGVASVQPGGAFAALPAGAGGQALVAHQTRDGVLADPPARLAQRAGDPGRPIWYAPRKPLGIIS